MKNTLTLFPIHKMEGVVNLPGSKSLSNRMLLLSALAEGETRLENVLDSDDVSVMIKALRDLGVTVLGELNEGELYIRGLGKPFPGGKHDLFLGNAGTAMRPLTAALTLGGEGQYTLCGVPRMYERPIADLVDALQSLGADITCMEKEGYPPLLIKARGLNGGEVGVSGTTSSQYLTALLMAAPYARQDITLNITDHLVSQPYVAMTIALMERFGVRVQHNDFKSFHIPSGKIYQSPGRALVEGDASSASYFLAGGAITNGNITVNGCGLDSLQGDAHFAKMLEKMGARVRWENTAITVEGRNGLLRGIEANMEAMPDAAMTLAVVALFAHGSTTLTGIANWRVKETDRMAAVSNELQKLGARTEVGENHLVIHPPNIVPSARIATYDDHRMAMAFSLAACGGSPLTIEDPSCVAKTFPDYFEVLTSLTAGAAENPGAAS